MDSAKILIRNGTWASNGIKPSAVFALKILLCAKVQKMKHELYVFHFLWSPATPGCFMGSLSSCSYEPPTLWFHMVTHVLDEPEDEEISLAGSYTLQTGTLNQSSSVFQFFQSCITRWIKQLGHDQNDTRWATFLPHTSGDYLICIILLLLSSVTAAHYAIWLLSYLMMSNVILSAKMTWVFH